MYSKIKTFLKTKKGIFLVALVVLACIAFFFFRKDATSQYESAFVERRNISQEVSVSGKVEAAADIALSFERGGQVVAIQKRVGDSVKAGESLVLLNNAAEQASLAQARADLELEKIRLASLKGEAIVSGITTTDNDVRVAQITLDTASKVLADTLRDAMTRADDAVRNHTDSLFRNPTSSYPSFGVTVQSGGIVYSIDSSNSVAKSSATKARQDITDIFNSWEKLELSSESDLPDISQQVIRDIIFIQGFLDTMSTLVNGLKTSGDMTLQSIYEGYRSNVSTARTTVHVALANVRSALESYEIEVAKSAYVTSRTSVSGEDTRLQEARVASAEARVQQVLAAVNQGIIRSPVDGIVTSVKTRLGEVVAAHTPIVTVVSDTLYQVVLYVPEADIAKLSKGNEARITLDAYSSTDVFRAGVISIDLSSTIIDGVPTYKTVLEFADRDERIRSGMTANADIQSERKENVLSVPTRAVVTRSGQRIVRVINPDKTFREVSVEVGLRGSDGYTEIVSGLSEGEEIVTFIQE